MTIEPSTVTPELRDLEFFRAVERTGSFGAAARSLMVSQPSVSQRIANLERVVGRPLFVRSAHGTELTAAGTALVPYAERCLALAVESLEAARDADGSAELVVAVHSTFAARVVPLVVAALGHEPRRLVVRDVHSEDVGGLVLAGAAHVGFALGGGSSTGLRRRPLPVDPVVCVAPTGSPVAERERVAVSALAEAGVALNPWGDGLAGVRHWLASGGVADWRIRTCGDVATALALARDHGHAAFVAASAVGSSSDGLRILRPRGMPSWRIQLDLLLRRDHGDDPVLRSLTGGLVGRQVAPGAA